MPSIYFVLYLIYLWYFIELENELLHWLTLVILPLALFAALVRWGPGAKHESGPLALIGLSKATLTRGLWQAALIGIATGSLQLLMSRQKAAVWALIQSGEFFYKFPLAFGMMLLVAASTEEFFFRGVLQTSLNRLFKSPRWGNVVASISFGLYHFPYAYKNPAWPSHGSFGAAFGEGVIMSAIIGLILGAVYNRYRNLLAPVIVHAAFNAVWFSAKV